MHSIWSVSIFSASIRSRSVFLKDVIILKWRLYCNTQKIVTQWTIQIVLSIFPYKITTWDDDHSHSVKWVFTLGIQALLRSESFRYKFIRVWAFVIQTSDKENEHPCLQSQDFYGEKLICAVVDSIKKLHFFDIPGR